jgi:hypothetical protein
MDGHRRRDPRAAVGDDVTCGELGQLLVPGRVERAGDPARHLVDRVRLSTPARFKPRIDEDEPWISEATSYLIHGDRVAASLSRPEDDGVYTLLAGRQRAEPSLDAALENRAVVVPEVAQEPPETLGSAHAPVRDDEDAVADAGTAGAFGEPLAARQRMPALILDRLVGQILVDVEKRRTGDVPLEVELSPLAGTAELPPAVDELVAR